MMGMKKIWAFAVLTSLFFSLEMGALAQEYPPGQWDRIIENKDFTSSLKLDSGDDNTLVINCKFHDIEGRGIQLRNVSNVYIKNCEIYNIQGEGQTGFGSGIHLRSTGSTDRVTIDGCLIHDIQANGIHSNSGGDGTTSHTNLVIKNNTIYNTGNKTQVGLEHNVYLQTSDFIIENNLLYNSLGGNNLSVRGSGIIRGNLVLGGSQKSGIRYYSDQPAGPSDILIIENNVIYEGTPSTLGSHPLISLLYASKGTLVSNYIIRFNTIVSDDPARYGFSVMSSQFDSKNVEMYGNIIINTKNSGRVLDTRYIDYNSRNYTATTADGFVNANTFPYDFHLTSDSPALGWATGEANFPVSDLDGQPRPSADGQLDAGADQTNSGQPPPDQPRNFKFKQP